MRIKKENKFIEINVIIPKQTNKHVIYSLNCPLSGEIMYIGCTGNLKKRYYNHLSDLDYSLKSIWIFNLKRKNLYPTINILEEFDDDNIKYIVEKSWILLYSKINNNLKNKANNNNSDLIW